MPAGNDTARASGPGRDAPDPLLGQQVRDLRIDECIGRGGMGAVYKAVHVLLGEPRALKVIRGDVFLSTPQAAARFQREARIAIRLRHPNLVLIHDFFIEAGSHFLVMEYVVGESLTQRLRREGPLSVDEACRVAIQCCHGLAHAHDLGIIHRDLSPSNVMLTPSPSGAHAKIIDFGIARVVHNTDDTITSAEDATLTRVGDFLGKPRYVSPEQAGRLQRGEQLDQRSDLYSLGIILYEMLTADLPFHADSALGYISMHLTQRPEPPSRRRPDLKISQELERVILCCLEKDRNRRFPDARALAMAIERAAGSRNVAATPAESRSPVRPGAPSPGPERSKSTQRPPPRERGVRGDRRPAESGMRRAEWRLAGAVALASILLGAGGYLAWRALVSGPSSSALESGLAAASDTAPAPVSAPAPVEPTTPEAVAMPVAAAPPAAVPEPELALAPAPPPPAPVPVPAERPKLRTAAPRAPVPVPAPAPVAPFASDAEMLAAYDEAVAFELSHDAPAAIRHWKDFRARRPSRDLDEQARRRITEISLAQLQRIE